MAQPPNGETGSVPNPAAQRSHGRGGAGNINSKPSSGVTDTDLATPTIKSSTYTTGRGGSGNMARNNFSDPAEARAAQDVETPAHHAKEPQGTYHWGRGGEGNMTTIGRSGAEQTRDGSKARTTRRGDSKERRGSFKDVVSKGKEMLGLKGKDGSAAGNESAIE